MFKVLTMSDEIKEVLLSKNESGEPLNVGNYMVKMLNDHSVIIYHDTIVETDRTIDSHELRLINNNGYALIPYNPLCHTKGNVMTVISTRPDIGEYNADIDYDDSIELRSRIMAPDRIDEYLVDICDADKDILSFIFDGKHLINKKHNRYYKPLSIVLECTNGYEGQLKVIYTRNGLLFSRELKEFISKFRIGENDKVNVTYMKDSLIKKIKELSVKNEKDFWFY